MVSTAVPTDSTNPDLPGGYNEVDREVDNPDRYLIIWDNGTARTTGVLDVCEVLNPAELPNGIEEATNVLAEIARDDPNAEVYPITESER